MNTTLWILQGVLALLFGMAGVMKSTQPTSQLARSMTWIDRVSPATVRFIGVSELLGAIGVILPWALNTVPILTPLAAVGLALTQVLAIIHHARYGEYKAIVFNVFLFAMAAFVAYGRFF